MTREKQHKTRTHEETPDLRRELLTRRYLCKDANGRVVESPHRMFTRVADTVAGVDALYGTSSDEIRQLKARFLDLMETSIFLPNSPTLMNAGRELGMLSACFVLPVGDSIDEIFDSIKQTALIQKAGGGTGFAFDELRPTGDYIASSGGTTSGPISFWRAFSEASSAIQQGAFRRGANMGMMNIHHPDILKFLHAKDDPTQFTNYNVSVKITDEWMDGFAGEPGSPYVVTNPRTGRRYYMPRDLDVLSYDIRSLIPVEVEDRTPGTKAEEHADGATGEASANGTTSLGSKANRGTLQLYSNQDIWNIIVSGAHRTGEPGVAFIDRINDHNPTPHLGRIEATNPCGEQPLLPYEACNLGSINLAKFVRVDAAGNPSVDWDGLRETVHLAIRFLDNVIDANRYPLPEIDRMCKANRKIGLGIMGFADALVLLGMRYDSEAAHGFALRVAGFIQEHAHAASARLAEERGKFPNWAGSTWDTTHHVAMRNASCTTIAPTGSISIIAGCSSGIEPIYSLAYRRRALDGEEFVQVHPLLAEQGRGGRWLDDRVQAALLEGHTARDIPEIPKPLAKTLVTAHEVAPEWHVRMQAAFQQHVDNAVSKTVNLLQDAGVAEVDKVFHMAFQLGCKGITVYRDGSRTGQTLSVGEKSEVTVADNGAAPRARSRVTSGQTFKFRMGCGTLFVTVNRDECGLCEVFANLGKAGGCPSQSEATCRAVSTALRAGVSPRELIEQLRGIRCLSTGRARNNGNDINVLSCPDAIAKAIEEALGDCPAADTAVTSAGRACPFCGHRMRREAGCFVCDRCLHSSCG